MISDLSIPIVWEKTLSMIENPSASIESLHLLASSDTNSEYLVLSEL